ncbi:MAG: RES family NAD+ phosphorylase [Candidatus Aminicenantes bacterium]|nr:RES family NAD+ phosphorylase [Candidatus Aminicenantes bacterium]
MKPYDDLLAALEETPGIPIEKSYYRMMGIKYLKNPLSALGSKFTGGRYNYIGEFEVLYLAPNSQTALQETITNINFRFPPKSLVTIDVDVRHILNLRSKKVINFLGININNLFNPWRKIQDVDQLKAYTQNLGRAVYDSQIFEGIQYPSAKVKGKYNLAIFPARLRKKSSIKVYDPDKILEQVIAGKFFLPGA